MNQYPPPAHHGPIQVTTEPWYHRPGVIFGSLLFCFPLGFYGLWTSPRFSKNFRVGITGAWVFLALVGSCGGGKDKKHKKGDETAEASPPPVEKAHTANPVKATKKPKTGLDKAMDESEPASSAVAAVSAAPSASSDPVADAKAKADEEKKKADEEKKRLGARKFIYTSPEGMTMALLAKNDPDELWATQYDEKYVRWNGKFERTGIVVKFIATAGDLTSFSCKNFDPAHDAAKFDLAQMKPYAGISVEGKLDTYGKQMGKNKMEFMLTECIAKKL